MLKKQEDDHLNHALKGETARDDINRQDSSCESREGRSIGAGLILSSCVVTSHHLQSFSVLLKDKKTQETFKSNHYEDPGKV